LQDGRADRGPLFGFIHASASHTRGQQPAATMGSLHDRDWRTTFFVIPSAVEESLII
jgi:hypothetical protein